MAQLNRLTSYYHLGMMSLSDFRNPEPDFSGIWPVFEAMAFIDHPELVECGAELPTEEACNEYLPSVAWIEFLPNDPFSTPTHVPPGYLLPPWYNNPLIPLPGVLPTDAMVNFLAMPVFASLPTLIEQGLPRARVNFTGTGEVEIEFVKVPQGGYALTVVDGDPLTNELWDLLALSVTDVGTIEEIFDIVVGQNLNETSVAEFHFDTPGDHFIDITFLPQISGDAILGMGGGIRRVSLCGDSLNQGAGIVPEFRVSEDGCHVEIRINPGSGWIVLPGGEICGEDGTDTTLDVDNYRVVDCQLELNEPTGWAEIPGAEFVPLAGTCAMYGGLEIYPTSPQKSLSIRSPYSNQADSFIELFNNSAQRKLYIEGSGSLVTDGNLISRHAPSGNYAGLIGGADALVFTRNGQCWLYVGSADTPAPSLVMQVGTSIPLRLNTLGRLSLGASIAPGNHQIVEQIRDPAYVGFEMRGASSQAADFMRFVNASSLVEAFIDYQGKPTFRGKVSLQGTASTNVMRRMAFLDVIWQQINDATRRAELRVVTDSWSAEHVAVRASSHVDGRPTIGFLGVDPIPVQDLPDLTGESVALRTIALKLRDFGLFREHPIDPPPPGDDWRVCYPFTLNPYWTLVDENSGSAVQTHGVYILGTGWRANTGTIGTTNVAVNIEKEFSAGATVTYVRLVWTISGSSPEPGFPVRAVAWVKDGAIFTQIYQEDFLGNGTFGFTSVTVRPGADGFRFNISSLDSGNDCTITITEAELRGESPEPTNSDGEVCP